MGKGTKGTGKNEGRTIYTFTLDNKRDSELIEWFAPKSTTAVCKELLYKAMKEEKGNGELSTTNALLQAVAALAASNGINLGNLDAGIGSTDTKITPVEEPKAQEPVEQEVTEEERERVDELKNLALANSGKKKKKKTKN